MKAWKLAAALVSIGGLTFAAACERQRPIEEPVDRVDEDVRDYEEPYEDPTDLDGFDDYDDDLRGGG